MAAVTLCKHWYLLHFNLFVVPANNYHNEQILMDIVPIPTIKI